MVTCVLYINPLIIHPFFPPPSQVKSRDHQFDSVPHLVNYFTSREIPLVIGKSQVFLKTPVINAFPSRGTH